MQHTPTQRHQALPGQESYHVTAISTRPTQKYNTAHARQFQPAALFRTPTHLIACVKRLSPLQTKTCNAQHFQAYSHLHSSEPLPSIHMYKREKVLVYRHHQEPHCRYEKRTLDRPAGISSLKFHETSITSCRTVGKNPALAAGLDASLLLGKKGVKTPCSQACKAAQERLLPASRARRRLSSTGHTLYCVPLLLLWVHACTADPRHQLTRGKDQGQSMKATGTLWVKQ
jgi:hypothetical protein